MYLYSAVRMLIFRTYWDTITVFVLATSFISTPIQLAFYVYDLTQVKWVTFNLTVDFIFIVDIILNFQTGYVIQATDEVSAKIRS